MWLGETGSDPPSFATAERDSKRPRSPELSDSTRLQNNNNRAASTTRNVSLCLHPPGPLCPQSVSQNRSPDATGTAWNRQEPAGTGRNRQEPAGTGLLKSQQSGEEGGASGRLGHPGRVIKRTQTPLN
ncbi:hypothetical protein PAMP_020220 [Pampus punctatissimus]